MQRWKPITEPPEKSGYVLIAGTHHRMPVVLMGFCKIYKDGNATFSEDVYHGNGVQITHWMPKPRHPWEKEERQ